MIDKNLLRLLGDNKKYIFYTVGLMVLGLFANVGITAAICWVINLAIHYDEYSGGATIFLWPAVCAVICIIVRYTASRLVGDLKDTLGRKAKKDLRERVYNKIVKLGVRSTDGMSMAGLTQVSMEGVEQLDLYYSSYARPLYSVRHHCMDRMACGSSSALLCTANSRVYHCRIQIRKEDICKVLGQIYLDG